MPRSPENYELLRGIREYPQDLGRRLIYADWVEEHGDPERAEFMRSHIKVAEWLRQRRLGVAMNDSGYVIEHSLSRWLNGGYADVYLGGIFEGSEASAIGVRGDEGIPGDCRRVHFSEVSLGLWNVTWWGGFLGTVELNIHSFLSHAGLLAAHAPITEYHIKGFSAYPNPGNEHWHAALPEPKTSLLQEYHELTAGVLQWTMMNQEITKAAWRQRCQSWAKEQAEKWLKERDQ